MSKSSARNGSGSSISKRPARRMEPTAPPNPGEKECCALEWTANVAYEWSNDGATWSSFQGPTSQGQPRLGKGLLPNGEDGYEASGL